MSTSTTNVFWLVTNLLFDLFMLNTVMGAVYGLAVVGKIPPETRSLSGFIDYAREHLVLRRTMFFCGGGPFGSGATFGGGGTFGGDDATPCLVVDDPNFKPDFTILVYHTCMILLGLTCISRMVAFLFRPLHHVKDVQALQKEVAALREENKDLERELREFYKMNGVKDDE